MPRKFLKRYLPDPHEFRRRRELRFLGKLLEDPFLLHLNRRSVAGGFALGLFVAFIPVPGQMLIAAALAILLRVNLVIAAVTVWITNPITMPPIFYFCYRIGQWLLGRDPKPLTFEPTLAWLWSEIDAIGPPLLLGGVITGIVSAMIGYIAVNLAWRLHTVRAWRRRKENRGTR